jgi:hypothetical protein
LGKKLENPYSVENMQKAYDNLQARKTSSGKITSVNKVIKVSHLYIRWLPKSWSEYDELKDDRTLMLYDIPLDYEVVVNGNKYHDKSIPADLPTWQYTVIEKDYKFNKKIKYEILAEAYIPEKDKDLQKKNGRLSEGITVDELINEALTITNNTAYLIPLKNKKAKVNWIPAGRVTVKDTRLNQIIGVEGVYVRARRFLSIERGITDSLGNYTASGSFGGAANYALYWEAADFDVRSGSLGQAWVNGPFQSTNWNPHFEDGVDRFYAHVFRGAWRYHYGVIYGLCRPGRIPTYGIPIPIPISSAMKYGAFDSKGEDQAVNLGNWSILGLNNNIKIYRYETATLEYDSDEIFSSTIHETTHSTHLKLMSLIQWNQISAKFKESWPVAVEWYITQKEYRKRGIVNYSDITYNIDASYPINRGYQYYTTSIVNPNYSSIFIDILDNTNQNSTNTNWLIDNVTGYTIKSLEQDVVRYSYGISSLGTKLKANKPSGVTDAQIDQLINQF